MKRPALLCVFLFAAFLSDVTAQQRRLDSVLALNNAYHKEDSLKAIYLRETFRAYNSVKNYAKMELYLDSAIQLAMRLPNKSILAFTYYRAGGANHNTNRLRAITFYNRCIETAVACGASKIAAGGYLNLGALYLDLGDYPKSLEAHEHALRYFTQLGDEGGQSSCYMNMSSIYVTIGQYVKGMEYLRKALRSFEANGASQRGVAIALEAMLEVLSNATNEQLIAMGIPPANREKEIAAALEKGLRNAKTAGAEYDASAESSFHRNYGKLYERTGNLVAAEQSYLKAVSILDGDELQNSYADNLRALGNFYLNTQNAYAKGLGLLHNALKADRRLASSVGEETSLNDLSRAHEKFKNYDSSLYYFRKAIVVKDSIYSREREQEMTRRQLKIDFDIKERDYKSAQQLAEARLKQQEQQILLRNQQLQISDKEKTLQRLTFLQKQVELENQKKLQAAQLLQEQQRSEYETRTRDQQIGMQIVEIKANRRVSLFLGAFAIIVIAVALFIFNSRRKTVKLNRIVSEQKAGLEELVAVKDKIFSVVSHDMRTPVNNIIAFSSLLEDGDIGQERLALYLEQIKGTLDHTSSLMENMLNWAASQMQGFTPVIEPVNITGVASNIIAGMAPSLHKKKINCINHIEKDIWVKGDQNMVELIVRNLLNNAIKFSHENGTIEVSVESVGSKILFHVKDAGVGMNAEKTAQVNAAHTHAVQSTPGTGKEKGTGLGLMLCKHFAHLMGGSITVDSREGEGSIFSLVLTANS